MIGFAYGTGYGVDGREAALDAMQRISKQANTGKIALALAFVSQEYEVDDVLAGLRSMLGNTPVWGISTPRPFTAEGESPRSILVALFTGPDIKARVGWFPDYTRDGAGTARQLAQQLDQLPFQAAGLLLALDGLNGDITGVLAELNRREMTAAGCLAGGDVQTGKTFQLAGNHCGSGGLALAVLGGRFKLGIAYAHGWKDIGMQFTIGRVNDVWVHRLAAAAGGDMTPAEAYEKIFGFPARDWAFPPLKELARIYPLGIENAHDEIVLRAPVHVEVNGSFRMNAPIQEGWQAHVMVGDRESCLQAAAEAAQSALDRLGQAKPIAALVWVDQAWQHLFSGRSGVIITELTKILGNIPILGAYTLGQVVRSGSDDLQVHNQNILVVVLGDG